MGKQFKSSLLLTLLQFLLQFSFAGNPAFFSTWEKSYYRKHPNNDNYIFMLPTSACFQQHLYG